MFVIETLSKPPWQQEQKHDQTKDSMGTQIAHYVCFIIVFIFHLFSETKQHIKRDFLKDKTVKTNDKVRRFGVVMTPLSR